MKSKRGFRVHLWFQIRTNRRRGSVSARSSPFSGGWCIMHIWTTPYLNSLLSLTDLPVRLVSDNDIGKVFLEQSGQDDVAVLPFDTMHRTLPAQLKKRGREGPVLFISPEPVMIETGDASANALVLDLKKTGLASVKAVVGFMLHTALHYQLANTPSPVFENCFADCAEEAQLAGSAVTERLSFALAGELPIMAAIQIQEHGEPVTARGVCALKSLDPEGLTLHRFRQAPLLRGMKAGMMITLYFSCKQQNHGALVQVRKVAGQEVQTALPRQLFITREMRIQPNKSKPVSLYMHIPQEPTTNLRVLDLSPRGLGFVCGRDLPVGGVYGLTLILPDPAAVVLAPGVLRFKKEGAQGFRYGAEIRPHPWDREHMAQYIMRREAELINLLRNEPL